MSHNDFIRPSNNYFGIYVMGPADFERWDVQQFKALNGDDGGAWNSTKPIIVGGAGMALTTASSIIGAGLKTSTGGRVVLGANDFPAVNARSRSVVMSCLDLLADPAQLINNAVSVRQDDSMVLQLPPLPMGILIKNLTLAILSVPARYLHSNNGANLSSIVLGYRITQRSATLPKIGGVTAMPTLSFFAISQTGAVTQPTAGGAQWAASTHYAVGSYVVPTLANDTGLYYKATSESGTGTSGSSEPAWPTVVGNTVTDNPGANQIVWTCIGRSGRINANQTVDQYYGAGNPQTLGQDFDPATTFTVDGTNNRYLLEIANCDPTQLLATLQFNFNGITQYGFE